MPMKLLSMKTLPVEALLRQSLARLASVRPPVPEWLRTAGWRVLAGALLLGGIVHICATMAAPTWTSGHAYLRLSGTLPANKMVVLPLQAPGREILPYLPPDVLYAMCRYDLSAGPVAVTAAVADAGWALSLHTDGADNFYVLPGQPQRRTEVSFLLVPGGSAAAPAPEPESPEQTRIASPTTEGLIVVRAPLRGVAWAAQTEAALRRASCRQVRGEE